MAAMIRRGLGFSRAHLALATAAAVAFIAPGGAAPLAGPVRLEARQPVLARLDRIDLVVDRATVLTGSSPGAAAGVLPVGTVLRLRSGRFQLDAPTLHRDLFPVDGRAATATLRTLRYSGDALSGSFEPSDQRVMEFSGARLTTYGATGSSELKVRGFVQDDGTVFVSYVATSSMNATVDGRSFQQRNERTVRLRLATRERQATKIVALPPTTAAGPRSVPIDVPKEWFGWPIREVRLAGRAFKVVVAADVADQARWWRGIDDPKGVDGVLMVFQPPTGAAFSMDGALLALDIAFFDRTGTLIIGWQGEPCQPTGCAPFSPAKESGNPAAVAYGLAVRAGTIPRSVKRGATGLQLGRVIQDAITVPGCEEVRAQLATVDPAGAKAFVCPGARTSTP